MHASDTDSRTCFTPLLLWAHDSRCLFSLMEMQTFLVELLNHFEFGMTEDATKVRRQASLVMVATIRGQEEKGVQMPLKVKFAPLDEGF